MSVRRINVKLYANVLIRAVSVQPPLQKILLFLQRQAQYSVNRPVLCHFSVILPLLKE